GAFSMGTNWVGDKAPGLNDTAVIDAAGANYTVTLDVNPTVAGFTLNSANASFSLSGRTMTVNGPAMLNAGSVNLAGSTRAGQGTLTNNATINVANASAVATPFVQGGNGVLAVTGVDTGTGNNPASLTAAGPFSNAGTITLTSAGIIATAQTLTVSNG